MVDTRASLLHAASTLLAAEGPEALTVRRIAAEAGVSTMGVYSRFGGKEGVIDALLRDGFQALADAMAAAMEVPLHRFRVPGLVARLAGEIGQLTWALTGRPQIVSRRKVRDLLQPRWTCSWAKAARDLSYAPAADLLEGFRQTFQWYQREGWL